MELAAGSPSSASTLALRECARCDLLAAFPGLESWLRSECERAVSGAPAQDARRSHEALCRLRLQRARARYSALEDRLGAWPGLGAEQWPAFKLALAAATRALGQCSKEALEAGVACRDRVHDRLSHANTKDLEPLAADVDFDFGALCFYASLRYTQSADVACERGPSMMDPVCLNVACERESRR